MKFDIARKRLQCQHCGNDDFEESKAQLNTSVMSFFDMDWLNKSSNIYICNYCGKIEWFTAPIHSFKDTMDTKADCLSCKSTIPVGSDKCHECGWTYN
ncbi:MAG: hypothetical protein NE328_17590 [Lentisphaeraceae bacterium]|nr:hypothetical protein [Lentisphaeraceae bacterium]